MTNEDCVLSFGHVEIDICEVKKQKPNIQLLTGFKVSRERIESDLHKK